MTSSPSFYDERDPRWPRRLVVDDRGAGVLHLPDRWTWLDWSDLQVVDHHDDGVDVLRGHGDTAVVVDPEGWPDPERVRRAVAARTEQAPARHVPGAGRPLDPDRPPATVPHTAGRRVRLRAGEVSGVRRVRFLVSVAFIVAVMVALLVARLAR